MRSKFTKQQKFDMIQECRSSGLSDYMWCKQQGICATTFYGWIKQLKKADFCIPAPTTAESYTNASKPDIVKLEIIDEVPQVAAPATLQSVESNCALEITIGQATIKVFNDAKPALLSQVMSCLGGCI